MHFTLAAPVRVQSRKRGRKSKIASAYRREYRRRSLAQAIIPVPSSRKDTVPGSGTVDRVIEALNVFCTNPFAARFARTVWYGRVLNCDAKVPVHRAGESLVLPESDHPAVDELGLRFCRLNSDPGGVQTAQRPEATRRIRRGRQYPAR
jgi:hypothetical protein